MNQRNFKAMIEKKWGEGKYVCVGLDSDIKKLPESIFGEPWQRQFEFNRNIIQSTGDVAACYKINLAFYLAFGESGLWSLKRSIEHLNVVAPDVPVILDPKWGDIDNTNNGYVEFAFDYLKVDAVTLSPYLGEQSLQPFLQRSEKGLFFLCATSNKGAAEFQKEKLENDLYFFEKVATNISQQWERKDCGLVVGATKPEEMKKVRSIAPSTTILLPGVGAQGGDLFNSLQAGLDGKGNGILINLSRSVIFNSPGSDYAAAARQEVMRMNLEITVARDMILQDREVKQIFADTQAVVTDSHFLYTSGKHGDKYINKDAVYPHVREIDRLCYFIARHFADADIDTVVAPALGGITLSQRIASHLSSLKKKEIFSVMAEKDETKNFIISRGQNKYITDKKVLLAEDILTTGGSIKNVGDLVKQMGGQIVGVGALCNRGNVTNEQIGVDCELYALLNVSFASYYPDDCPLCKKGVPFDTRLGKTKK